MWFTECKVVDLIIWHHLTSSERRTSSDIIWSRSSDMRTSFRPRFQGFSNVRNRYQFQSLWNKTPYSNMNTIWHQNSRAMQLSSIQFNSICHMKVISGVWYVRVYHCREQKATKWIRNQMKKKKREKKRLYGHGRKSIRRKWTRSKRHEEWMDLIEKVSEVNGLDRRGMRS